jgi:hypothetical protein
VYVFHVAIMMIESLDYNGCPPVAPTFGG